MHEDGWWSVQYAHSDVTVPPTRWATHPGTRVLFPASIVPSAT